MTKLKEKQNISEDWKEVTLEDLMVFERPDNYIVKSSVYSDSMPTPVLTANKSFILGYTDEDFGIYNNLPAVIFDDFTTDSKYVDFPFKIKSSAIKILKSKDSRIADLKFLYEIMKLTKFPTGNHKRYYISQYQKQIINLPPLKEQQKIAEILGIVDEGIEKTKTIIKVTEKLKRGLMQELFTRGIGHAKFKQTELGEIPNDWLITSFKEVVSFTTGKLNSNAAVVNGLFPFFTCSKDSFKTNTFSFDQEAILLAGNNAAGNYSVKYFNGKFDAYQRTYVITVLDDNKLSYNYLKEVLQDKLEELKNCSFGSTTKFLTLALLESLLIKLPSLNEQKEITKVLLVIDEKIAVNKKLLTKQTELKKGLMQDLLSGNKRVSI